MPVVCGCWQRVGLTHFSGKLFRQKTYSWVHSLGCNQLLLGRYIPLGESASLGLEYILLDWIWMEEVDLTETYAGDGETQTWTTNMYNLIWCTSLVRGMKKKQFTRDWGRLETRPQGLFNIFFTLVGQYETFSSLDKQLTHLCILSHCYMPISTSHKELFSCLDSSIYCKISGITFLPCFSPCFFYWNKLSEPSHACPQWDLLVPRLKKAPK